MIFSVDPRNQEDTNAVTVKLQIDEETCLTLTQIFEEMNKGLSYGRRLFKEHIAWESDKPARKARVENLKQGIEKKMNELTTTGHNYRQIVSAIAKEFETTWDGADIWLKQIKRDIKEKYLKERNKEILKMKGQGIRTRDIAQKFNISVETAYNIISTLKKPQTAFHTPRQQKILRPAISKHPSIS